MSSFLKIEDLSISFHTEAGSIPAVKNISFDLNRGEILAIVGESGSGKSVTALSILQLLPKSVTRYDSGKILIASGNKEQDILQMNEKEIEHLRRHRVGIIFQEPMTSLNPLFSCGDQVMEAVLLHKNISRKAAKERTLQLFEQVRLPNPRLIFDKYPHQLSGGQKQRVMIAMAMSRNPELLICDEPTTALDVTVQKTILELIRDLQKQTGMAVIFITHDLGIVGEIADRALVMYKGSIVEQGRTTEIFTQPKHSYTKALLACRPVLHEKGERLPTVEDFLEAEPGKQKAKTKEQKAEATIQKTEKSVPSSIQESEILPDNLIEPNKDNLTDANSDHLIKTNPDNLIEVNNLTIQFDHFTAVDSVSFTVKKGETLGLVGESGSGKTTLGRALLRLLRPASGSIIFNGRNITNLNEPALRPLRHKMQLIFQDPYSSLNPRMTIGEAISEPLKVHTTLRLEARQEKVFRLLQQVDLKPEHYNRYPHEFSGGQRQRIVIARALILNPSFIICDESVSALDVSVQAQVLNLLNELKAEFGFTAIFISHDLSVVHYLSDRIMVMNKGKIEEIGPAEKVYKQPDSAYTQGLIMAIPGRRS